MGWIRTIVTMGLHLLLAFVFLGLATFWLYLLVIGAAPWYWAILVVISCLIMTVSVFGELKKWLHTSTSNSIVPITKIKKLQDRLLKGCDRHGQADDPDNGDT